MEIKIKKKTIKNMTINNTDRDNKIEKNKNEEDKQEENNSDMHDDPFSFLVNKKQSPFVDLNKHKKDQDDW